MRPDGQAHHDGTHTTPIPVTKPGTQARTRIGAAGDALQGNAIADTGPTPARPCWPGAALLAVGAVTVAAAAQVAHTVAPAAADHSRRRLT